MREEPYDNGAERRVLLGMIVVKGLLAHFHPYWEKGGLFASRSSNLIGGWCLDYFARYHKAPAGAIADIFGSQRDRLPEEEARAVEGQLASLSREYTRLQEEDFNLDHLCDLAGDFFNRVRIGRLRDAIGGDLARGEVKRALDRIHTFRPLERGKDSAVDLFSREFIEDVFADQEADVLVRFPGDLGKFFGGTLERGGFVSFFGPTGRGKTFWVMEVAWQAILNRRRTLFFEVGDMNKKKIGRRFFVRATGRPWEPPDGDGCWPCTVEVPTVIRPPAGANGGFAAVDYEKITFKAALTPQRVWEGFQQVVAARLRSNKCFARLVVYDTCTADVNRLDADIQRFQNMGWAPDVVVVDYADVLAPPPGVTDLRDKINQTWMHLRRLSEKHQVLLVTATQSNSPSYTRNLLGMDNFSDDRRKNDHVTAMIGINQTEGEKEAGVTRLNYVKLREGHSSVARVVHVAGSLALANPAVVSVFPKGGRV